MPSLTVNRFHDFVRGFVAHKLRENGISLEGFEFQEDSNPSRASLHLRRVTNELMMANEVLFANMCDRLNLTETTTYSTFVGIANEIFETGNNWGRIVAFFAFGSTLSVYCARRQDLTDLVSNIVNWLSTYMDQHLGSWFDQNGGWDGFIEFFQVSGGNSTNTTGSWHLAAVAGLGLGALLVFACK